MKCFARTDQAAHFLGAAPCPSLPIGRVCVDSRKVQPGDLFVALPGEKSDGHLYIDEAEQRGACAAIVQAGYTREGTLTLIPVNDPLNALQALAGEAALRCNARIIGVTGSVGKTTTKEMIATLLEARYRVACSPGNYNSQVGLPLTLLNHIHGDEEFLILEMAMSEAGNIDRLTAIAPPDVAVITYIGLVHAAFFSGLEGIAFEKSRIFCHRKTRIGFYPKGIACESLVRQAGSCIKVAVDLKEDPFPPLPFSGDHLRNNFLLAAAVAREYGLSNEEIVARIPALRLPERRNERIEKEGITFVNDSYNASTPSVIAALRSMPPPSSGGRKIAVLGEMKELGLFSEKCHRAVGEEALHRVDELFCLGEGTLPIVDLWKNKKRPVTLFHDRGSLTQALSQSIAPGDVILIKGANSQQLWKVIDDLFAATVSA